ncbi:hypothetical protein [Methylobrevis albus]|uniref:Uncharacterized protein n=1 Tax=Methylobrevis albus TaxID=2793297 RepID=A0A931I474_9HYPH|nr:hypothetical protein [Methylobrevis albus]MBH0239174.1 hypothetical protein [Methylobrevis albus]
MIEPAPRVELGNHIIHFRPGNKILVVTFDHLGKPRELETPWASAFVSKQGWSLLGITTRNPDWFRAKDLQAHMIALAETGFFQNFDRVVFTGPSMGGFGACVFSSLSPGATVVVTSPQTTMDKRRVPWDERYAKARRQNWDGRFADAAEETQSASSVIVVYDPDFEEDRRHAERLPQSITMHLHLRGAGHTVVATLSRAGLLKTFMLKSILGEMTPEFFAVLTLPITKKFTAPEVIEPAA